MRRSVGNVLVLSAILFVIGLLVASLASGQGLLRLRHWDRMNHDNSTLRHRLDGMLTQLDSIEDRLCLMQDWEDRVRDEEHLRPIDPTLRAAGIGGVPREDRTFADCDSDLHHTYNRVIERMRQIGGITNYTLETHREVLDKISIRDEIFHSTPSIYPAFGRFSCSYGWRTHPVSGRRDFHRGLDISNSTGSPIYATADGVVTRTTFQKYMGNYIELRHGFGYVTRYGHLDSFNVAKGDEVKKGQIIGLMGRTGRTTGPHVHYEVIHYGKHRNPWYFLSKTEDDIRVSTE
ncbi:MAG: M23 family metallopeptidase [Candidatus Cloacimonetes bacterium]|nr:M23 family metallopeptidase [Candidatus Cloacimonadota bacterium]